MRSIAKARGNMRILNADGTWSETGPSRGKLAKDNRIRKSLTVESKHKHVVPTTHRRGTKH